MMQWVRRLATVAGMLALTLTTGCPGFFVYPGGNTGGSSGNYVYVANSATSSIGGFSIGTGTLTALSGSPYSLAVTPVAIAVNPANSILFVGSNSLIYAYAIQTGGALSVLNSGSAVGIANVVSMDISPDGQWLFALDGNNITLDEFQINSSTGMLTQQTGASYLVPGATVVARAVKIAPNGQNVFAALGTGGTLVFPFNTSTGVLSTPLMLAPVSASTGDNALAVSPASTYLFLARSGTSGGLSVYSIGSGGALTSVIGSPFTTGNQPSSVALNKAGNNVYVANQLDSTISAFNVASNGVLTAVSGSPYPGGSAVTALAAERTGTYMLAVARGGSPDLSMYSFDQTIAGKLNLSTSTATGTSPTQAVAIAAVH
jgi:6-phosphogluconolactonase